MAEKIAKMTAEYVEKSSKHRQHCGNCSMFKPPRGCTLVKGDISAAGYCKFYEAADDKRA